MLKIFIESACSNGTLSDGDRNLIFKKGKEQGINEAEIKKMIDDALQNFDNNNDLASGFITEDDNENLESGFIIENNDSDEKTTFNNNNDLDSGFITNEDDNNTTKYPASVFSNVTELDSQGAMSLVQKGQLHGKWIIIKRIKPKYKDNDKYKELFFKEFENAYHLDHPNIVRLLDKGEDAEGAYYTMEFVDGRALSDFIKKSGVTNERHVKKIFVQLLDGLTYVHKKQIFHRDLKPDNIYLTFRGDNVKILDFGLAAADSFEDDLVKVGTPRYAAPEQMTKGNTVDQRADIYTVGLILLEMLTGDVADKTASKVANANYKHIIQKCLNENPNERFYDCQEILEALNTPIIQENDNNNKDDDEKKKFPIVPILIGVVVIALIVVGFLFKDKILHSFGSNYTEDITKANTHFSDGEFNSAKKMYDSIIKLDEKTATEFTFKVDKIKEFLAQKKLADEAYEINYVKALINYKKALTIIDAGSGYSNKSEITEIQNKIEEIDKFYDKINLDDLKVVNKDGSIGFSFNGKLVVDYLFDDVHYDKYYKKTWQIIPVMKNKKWGYLKGNTNIKFIKCSFNNKGSSKLSERYWKNAPIYCSIKDIEKMAESLK